MFCLEIWTLVWFLHCNLPGTGTFKPALKKHIHKNFFKKIDKNLFVCAKTLLLPRLLLTGNSFPEVNFKLKLENFLSLTGSQWF